MKAATQKKEGKSSSIGLAVALPTKTCNDRHCPFHGGLKLRGRVFTGKVLRNVFHRTVAIEFGRQILLKKYERFEKRKTRITAHVPDCLDVKKGSMIKVVESRPISKTKSFVAVEVIKQ